MMIVHQSFNRSVLEIMHNYDVEQYQNKIREKYTNSRHNLINYLVNTIVQPFSAIVDEYMPPFGDGFDKL